MLVNQKFRDENCLMVANSAKVCERRRELYDRR